MSSLIPINRVYLSFNPTVAPIIAFQYYGALLGEVIKIHELTEKGGEFFEPYDTDTALKSGNSPVFIDGSSNSSIEITPSEFPKFSYGNRIDEKSISLYTKKNKIIALLNSLNNEKIYSLPIFLNGSLTGYLLGKAAETKSSTEVMVFNGVNKKEITFNLKKKIIPGSILITVIENGSPNVIFAKLMDLPLVKESGEIKVGKNLPVIGKLGIIKSTGDINDPYYEPYSTNFLSNENTYIDYSNGIINVYLKGLNTNKTYSVFAEYFEFIPISEEILNNLINNDKLILGSKDYEDITLPQNLEDISCNNYLLYKEFDAFNNKINITNIKNYFLDPQSTIYRTKPTGVDSDSTGANILSVMTTIVPNSYIKVNEVSHNNFDYENASSSVKEYLNTIKNTNGANIFYAGTQINDFRATTNCSIVLDDTLNPTHYIQIFPDEITTSPDNFINGKITIEKQNNVNIPIINRNNKNITLPILDVSEGNLIYGEIYIEYLELVLLSSLLNNPVEYKKSLFEYNSETFDLPEYGQPDPRNPLGFAAYLVNKITPTSKFYIMPVYFPEISDAYKTLTNYRDLLHIALITNTPLESFDNWIKQESLPEIARFRFGYMPAKLITRKYKISASENKTGKLLKVEYPSKMVKYQFDDQSINLEDLGVAGGDIITFKSSDGITTYTFTISSVVGNNAILIADYDSVSQVLNCKETEIYRNLNASEIADTMVLNQTSDNSFLVKILCEKIPYYFYRVDNTIQPINYDGFTILDRKFSVIFPFSLKISTPPHQPLTNISFNNLGFGTIKNPTSAGSDTITINFFEYDDLEKMVAAGYYIMINDLSTAPYCLRDVTCGIKAGSELNGVLSKLCPVIHYAKDIWYITRNYLGKYNVVEDVIALVATRLAALRERYITTKYQYLGTLLFFASIPKITQISNGLRIDYSVQPQDAMIEINNYITVTDKTV